MNGNALMKSMLLCVCFLIAACDQILPSPRQKVVSEAIEQLCRQNNISVLESFATESSKPVIKLVASLAQLGDATGLVRVADNIAVACKDGQVKIVDEVRVSDVRYVVRIRTGKNNETEDLAVVLEGGLWKIAFIGN